LYDKLRIKCILVSRQHFQKQISSRISGYFQKSKYYVDVPVTVQMIYEKVMDNRLLSVYILGSVTALLFTYVVYLNCNIYMEEDEAERKVVG
jgi:hypothetical protein